MWHCSLLPHGCSRARARVWLRLLGRTQSSRRQRLQGTRFASHHILTLTCITGLVLSVVTGFSLGFQPDIGIIALGLGAVLALMYPDAGAEGIRRIDWSTIFMVGGIVTFVGVLQRMDAVNMLGHAAMNVGTPLVAAFVICMIAGLVSAFASTAGILAALVPMAVPRRRRGASRGGR